MTKKTNYKEHLQVSHVRVLSRVYLCIALSPTVGTSGSANALVVGGRGAVRIGGCIGTTYQHPVL